jgi:hypothetical protein
MRLHLIDDPDALPATRELTMWKVIRWTGLCALFILGLLLLVPALAHAQEAAIPDPENLGAFLQALLAAPPVGKVVLGLVAFVYVVRKFGVKIPKVGPFLATDEGGALLTLLTGVVGTIAVAFFGGVANPFTWAILWKGLLAGGLASAGYSMPRRLLRLLVPLVAKVPGIGGPLAAFLSWVSGADVKAEVAKKADAAYQPLAPAPDAAQAEDALFPRA